MIDVYPQKPLESIIALSIDRVFNLTTYIDTAEPKKTTERTDDEKPLERSGQVGSGENKGLTRL